MVWRRLYPRLSYAAYGNYHGALKRSGRVHGSVMLRPLTSKSLIFYIEFPEDDKLVKIFTEQVGKRMFFVKHAGKSKLAPVIQPLTAAEL